VREGWAWADYKKETSVLLKDVHSARIRIKYESRNAGDSGAYEADVKAGETVKTGGCGYGAGLAKQLEADNVARNA
jgi:hypothetical protein